jgi:hypothetical protein
MEGGGMHVDGALSLGLGGVINAGSSFQHGKLNFRDTREVSMIYGIEISASPIHNVT